MINAQVKLNNNFNIDDLFKTLDTIDNQITELNKINSNINNQIIDLDLNDSFIITNKYIIIDSNEYSHYSFINFDLFSDFLKSEIKFIDNYYILILTKKDHIVTYRLNSIDKIIYYVYNYHTKKINN